MIMGSLPEIRKYVSSVVVDSIIYVIGGVNDDFDRLDTMVTIDTVNGEVMEYPRVLSEALYYMALLNVDGMVYGFGGTDGDYDDHDRWGTMEIPTASPTTAPTEVPTIESTESPTVNPTMNPAVIPTVEPTVNPRVNLTVNATMNRTMFPTADPIESMIVTVHPEWTDDASCKWMEFGSVTMRLMVMITVMFCAQ